MKVFLFSDRPSLLDGDMQDDDNLICEIDQIDNLPDGFVEIDGKLAKICMLSKGSVYIEYVDSILGESEVTCSSNITCPNCGKEDIDSWEASDSEDEILCDNCGSTFSYQREIEVTYTSHIISRNDDVLILGKVQE